jgi:3-phosphoshikimate 1-carboxyvinyltransferase
MSLAAKPGYLARPAGRIGGTIDVPGDKSISHRALMLGALAKGETHVTGFLDSADCRATLSALRTLGVRIDRPDARQVVVHGAGFEALRAAGVALDMGNSGTAMRLFMGLLCGRPFASTLVGDESLTRRPMERVAVPLRLMGARIDTSAGCPPVRIAPATGLRAIDYALPMASAQVKSAILLAALQARGVTRVTEPAPTRDHTERMLAQLGARLQRQGETVSLEGGQSLRGAAIEVPGDFSSAAFFLVAGCLAAHDGLTIRRVGVNPTRTGLLEALRLMGARIGVAPATAAASEPCAAITVQASELTGAHIPAGLVPLAIDELPVLFIAAACARGETVVTGAGELRVKESDRLAVMAAGLQSLGARCELLPDGIRIEGGPLRGGRIASHGDHRIAMAFAIASVRATGPIEIDDVENVDTSFPDFLATARQAGLQLESTVPA